MEKRPPKMDAIEEVLDIIRREQLRHPRALDSRILNLEPGLYERVTAEMEQLSPYRDERWKPGDPPRINGIALFRNDR